jgi:hypothetical protein
MLAAALTYRTTNVCPVGASAKAVSMTLVRPEVKEIAVLPRMR